MNNMLKKITLPNGVRVLLIPTDGTQTVSTFVLFRVGSRYETKSLSGASHFIEHLMFKGTKRRPTTQDISRELDSVGAEYNAFTSKDWTGYYVKSDARHADMALDILEDMLFHSVYKEEEVDRERKVISEEIHMYQDNPLMHIEDVIETLIFDGNTLGWPIAGTDKTMAGITREGLVGYRDAYYIPNRIVIAIAGKIGKKTRAQVERLFGRLKRTAAHPKDFHRFRTTQSAPRLTVEYKETEQVQVALGVPAFPYLHPRLPALQVASNIFGGTMSSRLFIEIRERRGLAYSVRSAVDAFEDTGSFVIRAGLAKDRIHEALQTILREAARLRTSLPTVEELHRAKENLRGRLTLGLEDSSEVANWYGKQELFTDKSVTPEQQFAKFDRVTREDIRSVARAVLIPRRYSLAIIGPYKDEAPFRKLLGM